jgi:hypothetical protein
MAVYITGAAVMDKRQELEDNAVRSEVIEALCDTC